VPRKLDYTDEAIEDLKAVRQWQTQPGCGAAALRRLKAIRAAINRLRQTPCLHAVGKQAGTRELACEGHRVIYQVNPDTGRNATAGDVLVLRVFGPGQSRDRL
jgi:plasmid stabilization system protein ParE